MSESEFLDLAEATLAAIERAIEQVADAGAIDIESSRSGNLIEIELVDNGSKIIVNSQAPMQEIWVAAKSGGFHYKRAADQWIDTRSGEELFSALSGLVSAQAGTAVTLKSQA